MTEFPVRIWAGRDDYDEVIVYADAEGKTWVRSVDEFEDGRFAAIAMKGADMAAVMAAGVAARYDSVALKG